MKIAHLLTSGSLLMLTLPIGAWAQAIQRCEGANQRITYSNAACPEGSKSVKALAPAPQPSAESRAAAQTKLQRAREGAKTDQAKAQQKQPPQTASTTADDALRKAADCGYLQASIDSSRRLRNVLTTRPYYSTEDVDEADARTDELLTEYRRVC